MPLAIASRAAMRFHGSMNDFKLHESEQHAIVGLPTTYKISK
jgi:hypothetical protein